MNLAETVASLFSRKPHFENIDLGVLNVAFMIAALDGAVTEEEYAAFDKIARECRGYTPENAKKALHEAMRSAGYLILLGPRVDDEAFAKAFLAEAEKALPESFPLYAIEDVTWAFEMWVSIAESDGDYSARERLCIEALQRYITAIRKNELEWITYSSNLIRM